MCADKLKKPTNCHFCGYLCAFIATVEDGVITALEPDTTRYPYDPSITAGCRRWKENVRFLQDPRRVNHPLKRVGKRGAGQFERVSWDEALDDIAFRLKSIAEESGPWCLASAIGGPHSSYWPLHRFMNLFGSPNNMGIGTVCWNPRILMDTVTFGWPIEADVREDVTGCLVIWGTNPAQSDNSAFWRSIVRLSKSEMPIAVVDPRLTQTARLADLWISPKPGTDGALAMGLIRQIFEDGMQDKEFIADFCHGAEELRNAASPYTPEAVERICDVSKGDVVRLARMFARASAAAIISGRGIDQVGSTVAPTHRAIACLRAITGNVDKPGSCVISSKSDFTPEVDLELGELFSDDGKAHCLNIGHSPLHTYEGYEALTELTSKFGRVLPKRYLTSAHPNLVWRAACGKGSYRVRALIVESTNPLLTYADTHLVFEAFNKLDLIVALEYTMTSSAMMADYVLPAASAMERPLFQIHGGVANIGYGGPAAVRPAYERRSDYEFFRELGCRLGQEAHWPDKTLEEAFDRQLAQAGSSWSEFCQSGLYYVPDEYFKHLKADPSGANPQGFATASGKVELASSFLESLGGQRVPSFDYPGLDGQAHAAHAAKAAKGWSGDRLSKELREKGMLFTALTGSRKQPYNASAYHDFESFRKVYPKPLAQLSPAAAARLGCKAGERVVVATDRGQASFTLAIAQMRDDIIDLDYGWWRPEDLGPSPDLGGIWDSNVNAITCGDIEGAEPMIGTWKYNGFPCVVWKES